MVLSPISPDRRQRFRCLLESANGPDLSSEASIGIAWTTNKTNRLRFDSSSLRVHLQAAIKGYLAAHRCVWPTISAPPVTARCGTESVGATTMWYAVEASNFLCICPRLYYGLRPRHSRSVPEAAPISCCSSFSLCDAPITGQETAR